MKSLWLVVYDFNHSVHGNGIALVNNFNGWPTDNHIHMHCDAKIRSGYDLLTHLFQFLTFSLVSQGEKEATKDEKLTMCSR